jgi:F-type H+-transporting ATPase subunit delta
LAGRYAIALFELAREQEALEQVAKDLADLEGLIAESDDLKRLIRSPVLSRDEQKRALIALADRVGCHALTRQFLGLVADKRRLFALPDMIEAFKAMLAEQRGEASAELISAIPLTAEQVDAVVAKVSQAVGKKVNVTTAVDPSLLGGLVVRVGSRMIDASLKTKLHQLELAMKGAA